MVEVAWPSVLDTAVTTFRALTGFGDPDTAGDFVPVFDTIGAWVEGEEWRTGGCVVVGDHGSADAATTPGDASQALTCYGAGHRRTESGVIACRVEFRSGDTSSAGIKAARDAAFAAFADIAAAVRVSPALGLVPATLRGLTVEVSALSPHAWFPETDETAPGVGFVLPFSLSYTAHL